MIPNYPEHVKIMFEILEFANLEIGFISDIFKSVTGIDALDLPSYSSRFANYGVDSPLFLDN